MGNTCKNCYGEASSADPVDDFVGFQNQLVIGDEPLAEVNSEQMKQRLHKYQVAIICRYKNIVMWSSGILISRNLVLTSAHNFFKDLKAMDKEDFSIYPGHAGSLKKAYKIEQFYVEDQYIKKLGKKALKSDYALIKLTENVEMGNDFIPLKAQTSFGRSKKLGIFGYPAQYYKSQSISESQYFVNQWGRIKSNGVVEIRVQNSEIRHCVSTLPGQSGSPMILIDGEELSIVGIHKGGLRYIFQGKDEWINVGRLMTIQLINELQQKAREMHAQPFKIWGIKPEYKRNNQIKSIVGARYYPGFQSTSNKYISKEDKSAAQAQFKAGQSLFLRNEYQQAKVHFINSISRNSNSANNCYHLGLTYEYTKDKELAILWYKKALEIQPNNIKFLNTLASAYYKTELCSEAAQIYRKILSKNQNHQPALMDLAMVLFKSKNIDQAINIYKKVIEMNPGYFQAHYYLGCANDALRQYDTASKCFERCKQIRPYDKNAKNKFFQMQKKLRESQDFNF